MNGKLVLVNVNALVMAERLAPRLAASGKDVMPYEQLACRVFLREVREMFPELPNPLLLSAVVVQLLLQGFKRFVQCLSVRKLSAIFNDKTRSKG